MFKKRGEQRQIDFVKIVIILILKCIEMISLYMYNWSVKGREKNLIKYFRIREKKFYELIRQIVLQKMNRRFVKEYI